ncbi:MAG TPA: ABC transporter permease [Acidimicrobiales bacterium]|nr:ABC transporter permease [Acidimicrobiales bacterium]
MTVALDRRRVLAVTRRHALVLRRAPQSWFDILVWPVVDTVIWGSIGVYAASQGGASGAGVAYMLSGVVLMHVLYQSNVATSTAFLQETWSRNLMNLMVTPLREGEFAAGVALYALGKLLVGLTMVGLAAWALYSFDITTAGLALVPVVAVLVLCGFAIAQVVVSVVLRFGNGAEIVTWGLLFVVVALSGAFYPPDALPAVLRPISAVLPTTHAFAAARASLDGDPFPWHQLALAAAGLLVILPLAVTFLVRSLAAFRRNGSITRYS